MRTARPPATEHSTPPWHTLHTGSAAALSTTCLRTATCLQALKGEEPLWQAVHRNVYGQESGKEPAAKLLSDYILRCSSLTCMHPMHLPTPLHACRAWLRLLL
jgi:hypothetical protein